MIIQAGWHSRFQVLEAMQKTRPWTTTCTGAALKSPKEKVFCPGPKTILRPTLCMVREHVEVRRAPGAPDCAHALLGDRTNLRLQKGTPPAPDPDQDFVGNSVDYIIHLLHKTLQLLALITRFEYHFLVLHFYLFRRFSLDGHASSTTSAS